MTDQTLLCRQPHIVQLYDGENDVLIHQICEPEIKIALPQILCITSFPPRQCGIATYSQDLVTALEKKFNQTFEVKICALEADGNYHRYTNEPEYILNTGNHNSFIKLAFRINKNDKIKSVLIEHEFGLFRKMEDAFLVFLNEIEKPVIITFHTILPQPDLALKTAVQTMADIVKSIIVMTNTSAEILVNDYGIDKEKITVIAHGTHLVTHSNKAALKEKYHLTGKKILSTFGLLGSGKSIETTLDALPAIIESNPDILFLIIGKTHPNIVKNDGEIYREKLKQKIEALQLQNYVEFINTYLPLNKLLDYLQLTDVYLFTSKDRNQAVSGTFSYAISCGCPIISTPIPHAREVLKNDAGIIIDFENSTQLSDAVNRLLADKSLRNIFRANGLHRIAPSAWENTAVAHANLLAEVGDHSMPMKYNLPEINLHHIKEMSTDFGIIQFAKMNQPDISSGYTLDDNARALIAICQHFKSTGDESFLKYISCYFNFIKYCFQPGGKFLNYVNGQKEFTAQNDLENLEDSNGRAIWALGYLISIKKSLPEEMILDANNMIRDACENIKQIHSTRALAFAIKGLYYQNDPANIPLAKILANRMLQMYRHEAETGWHWFESYLTYGNSILPEAMLCASLFTGETVYRDVAKESFDFLLSKIFDDNSIKVISNKGWLFKNEIAESHIGGEQPIDVAYTIIALNKFSKAFIGENYRKKMHTAFSWFLGNNHLHQIVYNPCTGGCYDGLEDHYINLNQGAESTVSYFMARLAMQELSLQTEADKFISKAIQNSTAIPELDEVVI